jgi:hypothetical protein
MLIFRGGSVLQRVMFLAAPLFVVGMLIWQRQPGSASVDRGSEPGASAERLIGPPSGIAPEEWQAAVVDFEGIVDSTFQCPPTEMPAYWRLLKWSTQQPKHDGDPIGFGRISFVELVNRPSVWRGRPLKVDLHVCRIAECVAPANSLGIERLYEVWGWSDDSRGSLYVAVTTDLPAGMSIGEAVSERATVCGYFYKIQGYLAAGSAAQSLPTAAPLVIGCLSRWEAPVAAMATSNELWLGGGGVLLALSFLFLLSQTSPFQCRLRQQVRPKAAAKLESWVDSYGADSDAEIVPAGAMVSSP